MVAEAATSISIPYGPDYFHRKDFPDHFNKTRSEIRRSLFLPPPPITPIPRSWPEVRKLQPLPSASDPLSTEIPEWDPKKSERLDVLHSKSSLKRRTDRKSTSHNCPLTRARNVKFGQYGHSPPFISASSTEAASSHFRSSKARHSPQPKTNGGRRPPTSTAKVDFLGFPPPGAWQTEPEDAQDHLNFSWKLSQTTPSSSSTPSAVSSTMNARALPPLRIPQAFPSAISSFIFSPTPSSTFAGPSTSASSFLSAAEESVNEYDASREAVVGGTGDEDEDVTQILSSPPKSELEHRSSALFNHMKATFKRATHKERGAKQRPDYLDMVTIPLGADSQTVGLPSPSPTTPLLPFSFRSSQQLYVGLGTSKPPPPLPAYVFPESQSLVPPPLCPSRPLPPPKSPLRSNATPVTPLRPPPPPPSSRLSQPTTTPALDPWLSRYFPKTTAAIAETTATATITIATKTSTTICTACLTALPSVSLPLFTTPSCKHPSITCSPCLSSWIAASLDTRSPDQLQCPSCPSLLTESDVRAHANKEVYARYDALLTASLLSAMKNFHWCLAPHCSSGQIHPDSSDPIFTCHVCSARHCIAHNVPWHTGETCEQYAYRTNPKQRQEEETKSKETLERTTKACPGTVGLHCGWRIEKSEGCDHMTCRKCNAEFCWECLADYRWIRKRGNGEHKSSCKYHTRNLMGH